MRIECNRLDKGFELFQTEYEQKAIEVLRSGWYILGNEVSKFEEEFIETYSAQSEIIDIMLLVRQTLALTEDIQFLCSEDCKGLCSLCGKNLNEGPCQCQPEILSPFAALKGKFK